MREFRKLKVFDGWVVEDFLEGVDKIGRIVDRMDVSEGYYCLEVCVDEDGREFLIFEEGGEGEYIYKLVGEVCN